MLFLFAHPYTIACQSDAKLIELERSYSYPRGPDGKQDASW